MFWLFICFFMTSIPAIWKLWKWRIFLSLWYRSWFSSSSSESQLSSILPAKISWWIWLSELICSRLSTTLRWGWGFWLQQEKKANLHIKKLNQGHTADLRLSRFYWSIFRSWRCGWLTQRGWTNWRFLPPNKIGSWAMRCTTHRILVCWSRDLRGFGTWGNLFGSGGWGRENNFWI